MNTVVKPEDQTERGFLLRLRVNVVDAMETAYVDQGEAATWRSLQRVLELVDARLTATEVRQMLDAADARGTGIQDTHMAALREIVVDAANETRFSDPLRKRLHDALWWIDGWIAGGASSSPAATLIRATGQETFGAALGWIQAHMAEYQETRTTNNRETFRDFIKKCSLDATPSAKPKPVEEQRGFPTHLL